MRPATVFSALVLFALAGSPSRVVGGLLVSEWLLEAAVYESTAVGDPLEGVFFKTVQNPFNASHTAMRNGSYSATSYDLGWIGDSASFDITANHYVQQLEGFTLSGGRILLTPAVDSIISAQGTWGYAWPNAAEAQIYLSLLVADAETSDEILYGADYGGNFDLGPPHGTLNAQDSGLLLAGRLYEVHYSTTIDFFTPTPPGTYGEASGEVHIEINAVPEPAVLAFLLPAALALRRRR